MSGDHDDEAPDGERAVRHDRSASPVDRFDDDGGVPQRRFAAPAGSTTLYLVRHGATQPAHPDRPFETIDGHGDPDLAPEGVEQARLVCARLVEEHERSPFSAVYVTTLRRTHQTAAPFVEGAGLEVRVEADLREVHLGEYEGGLLRLRGAEGDPLVREVYTRERWDVLPGAEPWEAFQDRCVGAVQRILAAHVGERVLVVVHGGVISTVLAHVTGSRNFAFVTADNTSVSEIVHLAAPVDQWILRRFNDVSHLDLP